MSRTHTIPSDLAGKPLSAVVKRLVPELSWSQVRRAIDTRRVRVGRATCTDESRRLRAGEIVEILEHPADRAPDERNVKLVHIDEHLIVVDKPPGMMTLRRPEEAHWDQRRKQKQPTLQETLQRMLSRTIDPRRPRAAHDSSVRVLDVHRLDRDTSGLMLFALTPDAQRKLIGAFKRHEIDRTYLAIVQGHLLAPRTIDSHFVRDRGDGRRGSVPDPQNHPGAQRAITHIKPIEQRGPYTVVECRLETGRTHQIRIHLAEIGHPLAGEPLYAHPTPHAPPRQALHSTTLRLTHPITTRPLAFASPLPPDLTRWLENVPGTV